MNTCNCSCADTCPLGKERDALRADLANLKSYHAELSHKHLTDADRWRTDLAKVTAERDATEAKRFGKDAECRDQRREIGHLKTENDALRLLIEAKDDELRSLREDKELLDWLETSKCVSIHHLVGGVLRGPFTKDQPTLRDAIRNAKEGAPPPPPL